MTQKIYLQSYDRHAEMLEYDATTGAWRVLARKDFERLGAPRTFGAFTREDAHVMGVFASPQGPVFFLDGRRVPGRFGEISASVKPSGSKLRFTLSERGQPSFHLEYAEREGIGTTPYDTAPEDFDLGAMLAAGVRKQQFFTNYTRDLAASPTPQTASGSRT